MQVVQDYNANPEVHGILVQLPLPKHMNEQRVLDAISLEKDVDGFHPFNIGCLAMRGREAVYTSCTPKVLAYLSVSVLKCLAAHSSTGLSGPEHPRSSLSVYVYGQSRAMHIRHQCVTHRRYDVFKWEFCWRPGSTTAPGVCSACDMAGSTGACSA